MNLSKESNDALNPLYIIQSNTMEPLIHHPYVRSHLKMQRKIWKYIQ